MSTTKKGLLAALALVLLAAPTLLQYGVAQLGSTAPYGASQELGAMPAAQAAAGTVPVVKGMSVQSGLVQSVTTGLIQSANLDNPGGMPAGTYGDAFHVPVTSYDASGRMTGFVNTAMQVRDAGGQVFNVMADQFGAKGDGVTDDHDAIQACIDAALATTGSQVFFPPPNPYYVIKSPLRIGPAATGTSKTLKMYAHPNQNQHNGIIRYRGPDSQPVMNVIGLQDSAFENIGVMPDPNLHNLIIWDQQFDTTSGWSNAAFNRWTRCNVYLGANNGPNNQCIGFRLGQGAPPTNSNGFDIVIDHSFVVDYNAAPSGSIGCQIGGSQNYSTGFYDCAFSTYCGVLCGAIGTALTAALNPNDASITVADIGLFPPSGKLSIGGTTCAYSGKTATAVTTPPSLYGPGTITLSTPWPGAGYGTGVSVQQFVDGPGWTANNGIYPGNASGRWIGGSFGANLTGYDFLTTTSGYFELMNVQGQMTQTPQPRRFIQLGVAASSAPFHVSARQLALKGYLPMPDGNGVIWARWNSTVNFKDCSFQPGTGQSPYGNVGGNSLISTSGSGPNGSIRMVDCDAYATWPFINNSGRMALHLSNVALTDVNGRALTQTVNQDAYNNGNVIALTDVAPGTGPVVIDASLGTDFYLAMTAAVGATRNLNVINASPGMPPINLYLAQPASGGPCSVSTPWFSGQGYTVKWLENVTPAQSTTASAIDQYQISQPVANVFLLKQTLNGTSTVPANVAFTNVQNVFTANQQFNGNLGIGVAPQPASNWIIAQPATQTLTSTNYNALTANVTNNPAATSTADIRGLNAQATWQGTAANPSGNLTGFYSSSNSQVGAGGTMGNVIGLRTTAQHQGAGTATATYGIYANATNSGGGTVSFAKALYAQLASSNSSVVSSGYGLHVDAPSISSSGTMPSLFGIRIANQGNAGVSNATGLRIDAQSGSGSNKAIDVAGGDVILAGSTLATNATNGFTNVPSMAGQPTGTPASYSGTAPLVYDTTNSKLWIYAGGWTPFSADNPVQGRLTLTSGTPVTSSDVVGASTIYFTPYQGNRIALYGGTQWIPYKFTEASLALSGLSSGLPYDVYGYWTGSALTLSTQAWTAATNRGANLAVQDGVYVQNTDHTRRYLGTIVATSATTTEDSDLRRFVANYYNAKKRRLQVIDNTTHSYAASTWRPYNNNPANKFEFVVAMQEDDIPGGMFCQVNSGGYVGANVDASDGTGTLVQMVGNDANSNLWAGSTAVYSPPTPGYHFIQAVEWTSGGKTSNFTGMTMTAMIQN